jgi:alpha-tubulin suppressor-like RCC1 family protein
VQELLGCSACSFYSRPVRPFRFVLLALAAIAAGGWAMLQMPTPRPDPLPPGKVPPSFAGRLLLAPDGTLWLMDYSATPLAFTPFAPGDDWISVSGSEHGGVALKEDGSLWRWSASWPGPWAPPTINPPVQLGNDLDWAEAVSGWNSALLRKQNGTVWFLGGKFRDSNKGLEPLLPGMEPVQVGQESDWAQIASYSLVHFALKRDGTLWRWGNTVYRGPYDEVPKQVGADRDWQSIAGSGYFLAAMKRDGSLWFQGMNLPVRSSGAPRMGAGFIPANSDTDWTTVVPGHNAFIAQKRDGSWWASGENHYSSLGFRHWFGHSKHLAAPKRIPLDLDPWAWSVGENTTRILTRDGKIYYMGKRPGSARTTTGTAAVKNAINNSVSRTGLPSLFARPGEEWSRTPAEMGELPPSVVSALKAGVRVSGGEGSADRR